MNTFIQALSKKRSEYANPDQAATQARSLEPLSSGIYTEDERFVYELLQNAVDAFSLEDATLDIKIVAQEGCLVVMHNGDAFTERDIEGLCDVGNGNKAKDIKKIGYKGIGFKSVFRASSCVYVESGGYCFKFDEDYWNGYWDNPSNWKPSFGEKDADKQYLMPWQIIPIEATAPVQLDTQGYNVVTYIRAKNIEALSRSVRKLMQTSQFLLFLKTQNVKMTFFSEGELQQTIEKRTLEGEVSLSVNGKEESRWLYYVEPNVKVPDELRETIARDQKTPEKLVIEEKGKRLSVATFDLSFAICIDEKKGERIVKKADNPVVYTYLPTEYKFGDIGFPFLVNANFLTNAGREHLIKDSEWNKMIIASIPAYYLSWIASFSGDISNYYEVLPEKSYGDADMLQTAFSSAMEDAIKEVRFIPNAQHKEELQCVEKSIIDVFDLKAFFSPRKLIHYVNDKYNRDLSENSWINKEGRRILGDYGVFILGKKELGPLFESEGIFDELDAFRSKKLIIFLQQYTENNPSEKSDLRDALCCAPFVFCSDGGVHAPDEVYFQTNVEFDSSESKFICDEIAHECLQTPEVKEWLEFIGVREFSCGEYLNDIVGDSVFIRKDNALEIGKLLYQAYIQNTLGYVHLGNRKRFKLLTTNGELKEVRQLYMSSVYNPRFDLQKYCDDDIFISDIYTQIGRSDIWHCIFVELGVPDDIKLIHERWTYKDFISTIPDNLQYIINQESQKLENTNIYIHHHGYDVQYYPHCLGNENNDQLKVLFSNILAAPYDNCEESFYLDYRYLIDEHISLRGDFWKKPFIGFNLREFLLQNVQKYPSTNGIPQYAKDLFLNTSINIELCGSDLPVLDIDCQIDDPLWLSVLPFRRELDVDDLLLLLTKISQTESVNKDDKLRVSRIYSRLTEQYDLQKNEYVRGKIKEWAQKNAILSLQEDRFLSPQELSYIAIEGFSSKHQVYTGNVDNTEALVELMRLFGVTIITGDNIIPCIEGCVEDDTLRDRLFSVKALLALLASDDKGKEFFNQKWIQLQNLISGSTFYSCQSIQLTINGTDAPLKKQTYAEEGKFYFVGEIKPATLEPLLAPLCAYLELGHKERELFVLLIESDYTAMVKFLYEKEYPIEWLPDVESIFLKETSKTSVAGSNRSGVAYEQRLADSLEAKQLALERLGDDDFDISMADITHSTIKGVRKNGIEYPVVAKSCKSYNRELFFNTNEWEYLLKPNSLLLLHFGNRFVAPIRAFELFTYYDKLNISFSTENLMQDERVHKIMSVLKYLTDVHLELATLDPMNYGNRKLDDYLFQGNNPDNSSSTSGPLT